MDDETFPSGHIVMHVHRQLDGSVQLWTSRPPSPCPYVKRFAQSCCQPAPPPGLQVLCDAVRGSLVADLAECGNALFAGGALHALRVEDVVYEAGEAAGGAVVRA